MFPSGRLLRALCSFAFLISSAALFHAQTGTASAEASFVANGLGKGTVPLDGPWQFHLGDNPSWGSPAVDDATGHNGWEQLAAGDPWGAQGHRGYSGYAWYRRQITLNPASGASPDFALLIPAIDDVYEIYWNGQLVGHLGSMPPDLVTYSLLPPQSYSLGPIRTGVLAVRVFKGPLLSNDDGISGGFEAMPMIGGPQAIAAVKGNMDFHWLRSQQFSFGLSSLYGMVFLFSFVSWLRDRSQRLLFWTASYAFMLLLETSLFGLRLHYPYAIRESLRLVVFATREMSLWFLVLWLLRLNEARKVARNLRIVAALVLVAVAMDSLLYFLYPALIGARTYQIADAALTCLYIPPLISPFVLAVIAFVRRRHLDSARWTVAVFAFLNNVYYALVNVLSQGTRFTHWTVGDKLSAPLLILYGSPINFQLILRTLLLLSIIYAVIRYSIESSRHQSVLEQEFQNARELQQVLIPESLPEIPGFALTSAYKPALEVGGDFFQIIPLEDGKTLVVVGDVSGKGLKAAMAVSLIVGLVRALARIFPQPGKLLAEVNDRLAGRLQGGFATTIALRLEPDGSCTLAAAGHPAPILNDQELKLPGALPLGLIPSTGYQETSIAMGAGDRLSLYTDGLLEARNAAGELFGFERLRALFSTRPNAGQATDAAVNFGQDDDITVLTLTRLAAQEELTAVYAAPIRFSA
jgi:hypothetical protein